MPSSTVIIKNNHKQEDKIYWLNK